MKPEIKIKLHHQFCKNSDCLICLQDHRNLDKLLESLTETNNKIDHLGRYRNWLDKNYPEQKWETEWGWGHPNCFEEKYIKEYVEYFKGGKVYCEDCYEY